MFKGLAALAAAALAGGTARGAERTVLVTNDDGLTANVVALYEALTAAGYDVIVSVPCSDQSGMGAALQIARPLTPLAGPCRHGAAKAGAPAAGPMTRTDIPEGAFFYVEGTPVMALLYGLDVLAPVRWGRDPDLVLSGPNEGHNVGSLVLSSGTVANAQAAALRGLPAIAFSAGARTEGDPAEIGDASARVATLALSLVDALADAADDGPLLPAGVALNVNFPDQLEGAAWRPSRIGTYQAYEVTFVKSVAASAPAIMREAAAARGFELPDLPGLSFAPNEAEPHADQRSDEAVVYRTNIAVSPMQTGYALRGELPPGLRAALRRLSSEAR